MERERPCDHLFQFRQYRTLDGHIGTVDVFRRNGQPAVRFNDAFDTAPLQGGVSSTLWAILSENLTPVEERRWWKLLGNPSIDAVAADERVSRAAIYVTIRGKGGRGGMIAKNPFVELWWVRRQLNAEK